MSAPGPWRMGYKRGCTFCWGAFGTLRENTIWLTDNLIFSENCLKIWFCMIFSTKIPKNTKKEAGIQQKWENGAPGWAKVSQRAPKVSQKWAKREPKGRQNEPGTSKRTPCGKVLIFDAQRGERQNMILEPFWLHFGPKSIKNAIQKSLTNRYRKSREN